MATQPSEAEVKILAQALAILGRVGSAPDLTPEESETARKMGLSPEQYAAGRRPAADVDAARQRMADGMRQSGGLPRETLEGAAQAIAAGKAAADPQPHDWTKPLKGGKP